MKPPALLLALLVLPAAAQTPPAPEAKNADPFDKTRVNIELLLGRRMKPPAFDPSAYSPFAIGPVGGLPAADPKTPDQPPPAATSESLLRALAPRLRVTGYFSREGLSFAVVDGTPRREGDVIILNHQGSAVNLRVRRVEDGRLVLGLGDAEYTLRF
ncbi:MAG TPA: hypothetical protein VEB66_06540 [Opitutaceae bacterium]|nr:hypothetical protein [Opitutaceae bacterium]